MLDHSCALVHDVAVYYNALGWLWLHFKVGAVRYCGNGRLHAGTVIHPFGGGRLLTTRKAVLSAIQWSQSE